MNTQFVSEVAQSKIYELAKIDHRWKKPLKVRCYPFARILPPLKGKLLSGGVCDSNGGFIEDTALHEEYYDGTYQYDEKKVCAVNRDAIFLGSWIGIYGHAITDNLKKLWPVLSSNSINGGGKIDYIYNYLPGGKLPNHIVSILTTLGINLQQLKRVDSVTQYNNIYVPDNSIILNHGIRYYTEEYKSTIQRIVNTCNHDIKLDSGIYLTRTNINDGKDYGEKRIENLFKERGYQIVSPEKLSFSEQVNMMNHCSDIVTTEGSLSHNALFLKKGSKLTVLRKADFFNGYQLMINQMNQLDVTYIDANHTIKRQKTPWTGPFFLWQTSKLNEYFKLPPYECSKWKSLLWYKYVIRFYIASLRHYFGWLKGILSK